MSVFVHLVYVFGQYFWDYHRRIKNYYIVQQQVNKYGKIIALYLTYECHASNTPINSFEGDFA